MAAKSTWRVLLAAGLLALAGYGGYRGQQRQASTLARIVALDSCLTTNNHLTAGAAAATVAIIDRAVARNRNQAQDMAVLACARKIQNHTAQLTSILRQLRQSWPASGTPAALPLLPGQLRQLTDSLRRYAADVPALQVPDLHSLPAPAARAALTRLEAQVQQLEADALSQQARKVGSGCCMCIDRMGAFAVAASNTVAPGALYEASLVLSQAAMGVKMQLRANGRPVPIDPRTNHGLVSFRVPPDRPGQPDTVRARWQGEIRFNVNGRDSVQQLTVPYLIVKRPQP